MLSIHFCLVASKLGRASGLLHRAEDFAYMQALQEKSAAVKDAEALQVCGPQGSPATQRFCSMRGRGFGVESCCVLFPSKVDLRALRRTSTLGRELEAS